MIYTIIKVNIKITGEVYMKKEVRSINNIKKSKTVDKEKFEFSKELTESKKIGDILGDRLKDKKRNLPS